ncbi:MAG: hypothetical protein LUG44_00155 [Clostridiales bacterium]|nr:hypothetical protein [Clostridiales bacterium]
MSYICLIANQNGIAAAGDSRLTFQPEALRLHLDRGRKVFSDQDQGLVWACCGLTIFGGVNYCWLSEHILRQKNRSLSSRLNQITGALRRATAAQHRVSRKNSTFTLLLGQVRDGGAVVHVLDVVNGEATHKVLDGPVLVHAGWSASLRQSKPAVSDYANDSLGQLIDLVKKRCLWAIHKDSTLAQQDRKHRQTVGGSVRFVFLLIRHP